MSTATSKTDPLTTRTSLPCGWIKLIMQPADHVLAGVRQVVLLPVDRQPELEKAALVVGLLKLPAVVPDRSAFQE